MVAARFVDVVLPLEGDIRKQLDEIDARLSSRIYRQIPRMLHRLADFAEGLAIDAPRALSWREEKEVVLAQSVNDGIARSAKDAESNIRESLADYKACYDLLSLIDDPNYLTFCWELVFGIFSLCVLIDLRFMIMAVLAAFLSWNFNRDAARQRGHLCNSRQKLNDMMDRLKEVLAEVVKFKSGVPVDVVEFPGRWWRALARDCTAAELALLDEAERILRS